jgi:hypothetical protein
MSFEYVINLISGFMIGIQYEEIEEKYLIISLGFIELIFIW